jgi:hypothetical protein
MDQLVGALQATNNPAQIWSSPSMPALYTFAYCKASSDRDAYLLKDSSKFPFHYLWLLWSTRWIYRNGKISCSASDLCDLFSQAIRNPTSNYRPEDAILSVEHFVASSGVIGEAELRVFFGGLSGYERYDTSIIDNHARLIFFTSLTLKLCQRSNVSMQKIFSLLMHAQKGHYRPFNHEMRLLYIFPLLRNLSLKTAPLGDNTAAHALETNLNNEISPELELFIDDFCYELYWKSSYFGWVDSYGAVSVLSLLPTLRESHLVATEIIRRLQGNKEVWRRAFKYCDEHSKSAYLYPLTIFIYFRTCSGRSHP